MLWPMKLLDVVVWSFFSLSYLQCTNNLSSLIQWITCVHHVQRQWCEFFYWYLLIQLDETLWMNEIIGWNFVLFGNEILSSMQYHLVFYFIHKNALKVSFVHVILCKFHEWTGMQSHSWIWADEWMDLWS
jgi:hypothetical protein